MAVGFFDFVLLVISIDGIILVFGSLLNFIFDVISIGLREGMLHFWNVVF